MLMLGRRTVMSPQDVARWVLDLCAAHPERIPAEIVEIHTRLAEQRRHIPDIDRAFVQAARSVILTTLRQVPFDRDVAAVAAPTLLIHGAKDRLVSPQAARRLASLRPDWQVEVLAEVGHIAMLEAPETFARLVTDFGARSAAA